MAKLVSRTYGDALFQLAVEENRIDTMFEEVRTVAVALQENPDLTRLMNHPKIDKEEKVKLIEDIFKGQVEDELVGLMRRIITMRLRAFLRTSWNRSKSTKISEPPM